MPTTVHKAPRRTHSSPAYSAGSARGVVGIHSIHACLCSRSVGGRTCTTHAGSRPFTTVDVYPQQHTVYRVAPACSARPRLDGSRTGILGVHHMGKYMHSPSHLRSPMHTYTHNIPI